jgi:hypothetical protein
MTVRRCPACGRDLETVKRGPFRVECWPNHNGRSIGSGGMSPDERNAWYADHRDSARANETDRCFESGQPV